MKKINIILMIALLALGLASCSKTGFGGGRYPVQGDMSLIGRAVNFDASFAQKYVTRATTYDHNGGFNENDLMTIYRQYWDQDSESWAQTDSRVYYYKGTYASDIINISTDWNVFPDHYGYDENGNYFLQSEKDSLVWDNGKTVRFRAWSRSNLANTINGSSFYPDYCASDWVTVSGPSQAIPLALKHVGCRLGFDEKAGNEISRVEICTSLEDYVWDDNSDTYEHDQQDKENDPESALQSVLSVYNKMCMPAGIDLDNYFIRTMTTELYNKISNKVSPFTKGFSNFEEMCILHPSETGLVAFGTMNSQQIATLVKRPQFNNLDGRSYMITSPYDMSNESTNGDVLVLPACTRFRVWLYDVNTGKDLSHVFALKDIVKDGQPVFKDGLPLLAGHSFMFVVGYQYDQFTVDVIEQDMAWDVVTGPNVGMEKDTPATDTVYTWWKDAIYAAAQEASGTKDFMPVFHISTEKEFEAFINLVNGTTHFKMSGLAKARRAVDNPEADPLDNPSERRMYWYRTEREDGTTLLPIAPSDTVWVTKAQAEAEGYIFYRKYHPLISTHAAYSEDWYLDGPYSFYHEQLGFHFNVEVTADIDFQDRLIKPVGNAERTPFKGYFDAYMHKFSNMNIEGEYLFNYAEDADIRNLVVESMRPVSILNQGLAQAGKSMRILGVSLNAPCTGSPIANKLGGTYGNPGRSYVIGCIYQGDSDKPMVGSADDMTMYGCMNIAPNVSGAALLGDGAGLNFFKPQTSSKVKWDGYFECNYFLREPKTASADARPVPDYLSKQYKPQQYIKGARSYVLRAVTDNLLKDDIKFEKLPSDERVRESYYGLAPYKAMNYAIEVAYNQRNNNFQDHPCRAHYTINSNEIGYDHHYPVLESGRPVTPADYKEDPVTCNN